MKRDSVHVDALLISLAVPPSPQAAATMLHSIATDAEEAVSTALEAAAPPAQAASTNPLMELIQSGHDQLYARLFQS